MSYVQGVDTSRSFFDLYAHGFARIAAAVPRVSLADPAANAEEVIRLYGQASDAGAALVLFPELGLAGYTSDDLHQQDALQRAVRTALGRIVDASAAHHGMVIVGAPLRFEGRLFNCAAVAAGGRLLGLVPKSYLPNYREFYEKRQFSAARDAPFDAVSIFGEDVPFGTDLIFRASNLDDFAVHVEICEDLWTPLPPSTFAAMRGATVLANLSASNITIGKAGYRRELVAGQSARMLAAYAYASSGVGESTTDLAWDGHALLYENGQRLAETERFCDDAQLITADVDLERLVSERSRMGSFTDCATDHAERVRAMRSVAVDLSLPAGPVLLDRHVDRHPFVPAASALRDERCREAFRIQVAGLEQRLRATGIKRLVIGISGGLDSTHALLVAVRAMARLGLPATNILAYTMPAYATSSRTLENSHTLMRALGVAAHEIDIVPACDQMLKTLEHPAADGEKVYDITFENVQAGERTNHLFRLANRHGALVLGTGDLSELALGWCTYGVGDHMSHYNVNASVPKTLIRHLIEWVAQSDETNAEASAVLHDVLATEISPELVPGDVTGGDPAQSTEDTIGPYSLHDFTLYHVSRRGSGPARVAYLATHAWAHDVPTSARRAAEELSYSTDTILRWLGVFLDRFFRTSQFKRSCLPNGPKVGSGGSLSPRGDWRAPSDATSVPWMDELEEARGWIARS